MNPCAIEAFLVTSQTEQLYYNVGDAALTDARYELEQAPNCGYATTVTIETFADFIVHNEATQDFTIYTVSPQASVFNYVTVLASISVPKDHT